MRVKEFDEKNEDLVLERRLFGVIKKDVTLCRWNQGSGGGD
jgi:hypothetical protein